MNKRVKEKECEEKLENERMSWTGLPRTAPGRHKNLTYDQRSINVLREGKDDSIN